MEIRLSEFISVLRIKAQGPTDCAFKGSRFERTQRNLGNSTKCVHVFLDVARQTPAHTDVHVH